MTQVRFELLGPMRAWRDGARLETGSPQQQAVLAVLLLARGDHVSMASMIDALWGDRPPKSGVGAVRTYVSRLRQSLGACEPDADVVIESACDGYILRGNRMIVDVDLFEERVGAAVTAQQEDSAHAAELCREALGLWRGAPLAGVPGPHFEPVRARIVEMRADAAEIELATQLASGDRLNAIAGLRALVADHPLRESLHELLMLALYRAGRQAAALEVYESARLILRDDLGIEPGTSLRRMHQRVLSGDEALLPGETPRRRQPPRASRLPADLTDFIGRRDLLRALTRQLGTGDTGPRVVALRGMPGIGKTTLALHAGHLVAEGFPDGEVFVELGGSTDSPMPPDAVLAALLRSAGMAPPEVPADLASRAWAWREVVADRRMLVVLDDVAGVEQVRSVLAAPAGCAFILTSRRTLIGLGDALCHEVPALSADESLAFLKRLIGAQRVAAEPRAARSLITSCAGQPLAIRAIGARLAARPGWGLASALRHLDRDADSLDGVIHPEAPLREAYRRLTPEQALVFRSAAAFEGKWIAVRDVAAKLGMSEGTLHELFESLTDVHLLKPGEWGAYRYDPVVKTFARRLSGAPLAIPNMRAEPSYSGSTRTESRVRYAHRAATYGAPRAGHES